LAVTRNCICPLPCPDAGDNPEIQLTSDAAVQEHSGCVFTLIELVPPLPSSVALLSDSDTPHLIGDGPVDTVAED
jgi:hypothetical protein